MSNAIDFNVMYDAIYDWIRSRSVVDKQKIYLEDPNADRPQTPSISYRILSGPTKVGSHDNETYDSVSDKVIVSGPRVVTFSIKSYGVGAVQIIANLHASLELRNVNDIFLAANMSVENIGSVQDISQEIETGIEERANLDVIFGVSSIQEEDQGAIETVNIVNSEIKDVDGTVKSTINSTITKP